MARLLCFLVAALCLAADPLERISNVEAGLRPGIQVAGEPEKHWTIEERLAHHKTPAVSIAVIDNGKLDWAKAYGVIEASSQLPADEETMFQAASISKPVSALAALRLVADGKLDLDADVNRALTSWKVPAYSFPRSVALVGLLSHSAGTTVHGFPGYEGNAAIPSAVQVLNGEPPANTQRVIVDIEPGSRWRYSGGGYTILQVLMSDVTGKPFASLLRDSVLGPLKMKRSTFEQPLPERLAANAARAHGRDGKPIPGRWHTYPEQAAAGLWTTPSDLAKVLLAVQQAYAGETRFLPASLTMQMLTIGQGSFGLGWGLANKDGNLTFSHGGANAGFRCIARAYAAKGQGAVIMTNSDNGAALADEILRSIAAEYGWPDYKTEVRTPITMSSEQLAAFAGNYTTQGGSVIVAVSGKGIKVQVSGENAEFLPESDTAFFPITPGPRLLVFQKDAGGKITGFRAGGMTATRKE